MEFKILLEEAEPDEPFKTYYHLSDEIKKNITRCPALMRIV